MAPNPSPSAIIPVKTRRARLGMLLGGIGLVTAALTIRYYWGAESANADPLARPRSSKTAARSARAKTQPSATGRNRSSQPAVVAVVNREQITRSDLGRECLRHYGEDVLESLVNRLLISQECKRRNISVTRGEVDAEIKRMAQRFSLPVDRWLKMLKQERGINPAQYASDIIWPTLALRKLAGERLTVTQDELHKAYETKYGPAVDARLISCKSLEKAEEARAAALADPDNFGNLAKKLSVDISASLKGAVQPIRKHGYYKEIEQAAFNMEDGEISEVIPAGGQYVIIQRKRLLAGAEGIRLEQVRPQLEEIIRDRKLRTVAGEIFRTLQDESKVENVLNDPAKRRRMPGVAALINGQKITIAQLAEQCIQRHGTEVLEGTINRKLIEQACKKRKITITGADLDREIARAAKVSLPPKEDGSPDVEEWLKLVTGQQGVSVEVYRHDSVWPSVALKKLLGDTVKVSDEDLRKGYEANYGPRVRCRAIVMNNLRRAQKVWEMARKKPTVEYFGELAEEYSTEAASRALRGEVPPIKKNGGQPILEKEAFSLRPGELSGIIHVDQRYIILFCEGRTKPTEVDFDSVRKLIYEDIHEKKQRLAMAKYFNRLHDTATIDNYLAGTSRRPQKAAGPKPAVNLPRLRQVPRK